MSVLSVRSLTHVYGQGTPLEVTAVDNCDFDIENGELVAIIGHTGSGKSTLIQHFNGLLKPTSGQVLVNGRDIWESKESIRKARFQVGLCFQYPEYQLFEKDVYSDIAFGPKNMKLSEAEIDRRVRDCAKYLGIKESHFDKSPFDLSGGEKRRVAIAGVMAMEPDVLLLDEPTAGLDPKGRDKILTYIKNYHRQTGKTVILVSHSMEDVAKLATRALVMNKGKIAMFGTIDEVYSHSTELVDMGLNVPMVTQVFMGLQKRGYAVSSCVYTVEQGLEEVLRLKRNGGASE